MRLDLLLLTGVLFFASVAKATPPVADVSPPADSVLSDAQADAPLSVGSPQPSISPSTSATSSPNYLRPGGPVEAHKEKSEESSTSFGRVAIALCLLGLLAGFALYLKRQRGGLTFPKSQVKMHVISSVAIGPKAQVTLLSVGREALLLGVTEGSVSALRVFGPDDLASLTQDLTKAAPSSPSVDLTDTREDGKVVAPAQAFQSLLEKASKPRATGTVSTEQDDELPAHLALALGDEKAGPSASFGAPEGQASELVRRFRELR